MMKVEFYECEVCGNLVGLIRDGGGELVCCGQPMKKLVANTTDAAVEKHVPIVKREDGKLMIEVGAVAHPMTEQHYIEWIAVSGVDGTKRIQLSPGDEPKTIVCDGEEDEVYAYCNLHGLWKAEVK